MASYPTAIKSFTTKNTGDIIQAAHVNDLQDEVNAIEAGLRNGTAPLNAAGSTVTSLTVTGGSTLATLSVSGASTLATLNLTGASTFAVRPLTPPPDAVRVAREAVLDLTNNTTLAVSWTRQTFAINSSLHSTGTNPMRLTPQSTGVYLIIAGIALSGNHAVADSTANFRIQMEDSSGALIAGAAEFMLTDNAQPVMGLKHFDSTAGDTQWVRVVARDREVSTNSVSTLSFFGMYKL